MALRIGFDLDGTLADFATAFRQVEENLFGAAGGTSAGDPEREDAGQERAGADHRGPADIPLRRRRDAIWAAIRETPDFWETLHPIDAGAVPRLQDLSLRHRWDVFFITQRPATAGDTVQRQTQRWLHRHGFELPSVLVVAGPRGAAAGALRLDYHVDDNSQNCLDVLCDSHARPLLVVPGNDALSVASARKLGIGTVESIGAALDVLEEAAIAQAQPTVLARLAALVGWR